MTGPLSGNLILELTRVAPGSFAVMMLADMGAEVIKVDTPPEAGTATGSGVLAGEQDVRSAAFNHLNRNKRSIAINLKDPAGQRVFQQLARKADVIVEGFRPGVMKRLGGDYDTLKQLNPRLIYCSMSGYGPDGPYKDLPGHDINYLSFGGVLELIGEADRLPVVPLNIVADYAAASMNTIIGILLALMARQTTGRGQQVDVSYLDGVIALLGATPNFRKFFPEGIVPKRGENALGGAYPYYSVFEAKDGKLVTLGCMEPWFWERVCRALEREDLIPLHFTFQHFFSKPDARTQEAMDWLRGVFKTRTRDEWFEFFRKHDVCVGKVYTLDEVFEDPQVRHRQMILEVEDSRVGKVKMVGIPIKLSDTPGQVRWVGPYLGENTDEILKELGHSPQSIAQWREQGVVA